MKTKLFLAVALFIAAGTTAFAQITTGEPTSKVIKTGNRPGYGDYGIYLGVSSNLFKAFDDNVKMKALPLINFKFMTGSFNELRLGLEMYKTSQIIDGYAIIGDSSYENINQTTESNILLYPGWAYHFSSKNILDVYIGAELPLGYNGSTKYQVAEENISSVTKRAWVLGLGAFVGLQAFVADLPLAIGAEFGVSSLFDCGVKYLHQTREGDVDQVYYTSELDPDGLHYDALKARKGQIGSQVRLTVTYYFK